MDPKQLLKNRYSSGVTMVYASGVLTVACQALYLLDIWKYFPISVPFISLWLPYYGLVQVNGLASDTFVPWAAALILLLLPVSVMTNLGSRAKNGSSRGLIAALIIVIADGLFVAADMIFGFSGYGGLHIGLIVHMLYVLFIQDALKAGKALEKGTKQARPSTPEEEAAVEKMLSEENDEDKQEDIICRYSRQYAREHNAQKGWLIPAVLAVFAAVLLLGYMLCAGHLNTMLGIDSGTAVAIFLILLVLDFVLLIVALFRLSVFTEAKRTTYIIKPYGQIIRHKPFEPKPYDVVYFTASQLVSERKDRWVITYAKNGRRRRAVIPKAFPRMEEYFVAQKSE